MRADPARLPRLAALLLLWTAWLALVPAGHAHAPPYPILETDRPASLGLFTAWLEDPDGSLDLGQVSRLPPERFTVSDHESLHFGFSRSAWWFRIALQNTLPADADLVLSVPHPSLAHVRFYRTTADGIGIVEEGASHAHENRKTLSPDFLFTTRVPAGRTQVVWMRVQSDLAIDFSVQAQSPVAFAMTTRGNELLTGLTLGLLLAMALLVTAIWFVSRRDSHRWYLLALLSIVLFVMAREGYLGLFLPMAGIQAFLESAFALAATLAGLQFARVFLDTSLRAPRTDNLLRLLILSGCGCLAALPWLDTYRLGPLYTLCGAIAMPATLAAGILAWRNGCPDSPGYLLARLFSAIAGSLIVFGDWGLLTRPLPTSHLLIIGASLEALLIARLLFLRDRHARKSREHRRLSDATRDAEQRASTDVLDRFGHDARAPLTGILGMTELLGDTSLSPRQREYVHTIRGAGENLLALLNDTMDSSRLDAGQLHLQDAVFDLAQVLADSLEGIQLRAEEKHLELLLDIDPALPTHVRGDPARLQQVAGNLLAHSVGLTNRGEIHVQVMPGAGPDQIRFEVRDTGAGIPRDQLEGLFRKNRDAGGSPGLGLVIAKQLVGHMGGEIGVLSEERRGTLYWFTLPLPAAVAPAGNAPAPELSILEGKRLLVVDDNAAIRQVLGTLGTRWGMQVMVADNGQEALALARSQANLGEPFDAVVVDHNMPGMSGLQLAARIKEDPLIRNDAVIVMLTGLNIAPTETMARNVGIRRVVTKPVAGRTLQRALAEEFERRESFEPPAGSGEPLPDRLRVLVVEDNTMSQKVIRGMLAKLGVRSDIASNGQEAIEAILHHRYDLILMDCEMPVVNGYDATKRIRAWERDHNRPRTPVIALSAHILHEIRERCREAGMDAHLAKPIDLNELRATLQVYANASR